MSTGELLFNTLVRADNSYLDELKGRLREVGFIGQPYRPEPSSFLVGERFMQLVSFVGCSPYLRLTPDPEGEETFCHIRFTGPFSQPRLITGRNTRAPRCRQCGRPITDWPALFPDPQRLGDEWRASCPNCREELEIGDLDWRQNGGAGRLFIRVAEIFPGEAVPVPALLEVLNQGGVDWDYFYLQTP